MAYKINAEEDEAGAQRIIRALCEKNGYNLHCKKNMCKIRVAVVEACSNQQGPITPETYEEWKIEGPSRKMDSDNTEYMGCSASILQHWFLARNVHNGNVLRLGETDKKAFLMEQQAAAKKMVMDTSLASTSPTSPVPPFLFVSSYVPASQLEMVLSTPTRVVAHNKPRWVKGGHRSVRHMRFYVDHTTKRHKAEISSTWRKRENQILIRRKLFVECMLQVTTAQAAISVAKDTLGVAERALGAVGVGVRRLYASKGKW